MAALIAIGVVGGVQAVRQGYKAHKDHKNGVTPTAEIDARGQVVKPHPVYRWVSKMEAKRKSKGEGSSRAEGSSSAPQRETAEERVMREKDPQMYSRPQPAMDAPPSYQDAVPAYEPPTSGFGADPSSLPEFPSVPTSHPSVSSEKILLALKDIGVDGEMEGLVDLMILGQHGSPPQIDVSRLFDGELPVSELDLDSGTRASGSDVNVMSLDTVVRSRATTAKQAAQVAGQINTVLQDIHKAYLGVDNGGRDELHAKLLGLVDTLEGRLNRLIQLDARLADLQGSPQVQQGERQRTPLLA